MTDATLVRESPATGLGGLLGLLQLADSCFPAGGFAFSNGLEGMAKSGFLRGLEDFRQYLECYLVQAAAADLPFLNSAWRASGDPEAFAVVAIEWDAFLSLPAPRRASLAQGQAWLRAMEGAIPVSAPGGAALHALRPGFRERDLPLHFLLALAASLPAAGLSLAEGQTLLLHLALRDQLGAAVRLGLVGSLQAQGLQRAFLPQAERLRLRYAEASHHGSRRSAPMLEMGQAGHPYLYSRLFQS